MIGIVLTVWLALARPDKLSDMERVYVEDDDTPATEARPLEVT